MVDPIDGSLNAKRGIPFFSLSIARADGPTMGDVDLGYVYDFGSGEEWIAERGRGAFLNGRPLDGPRPHEEIELLAFEATRTDLVAERAAAMVGVALPAADHGLARAVAVPPRRRPRRRRLLAKPARSVDIAAGQLLVRERGLRDRPAGGAPFERGAARRARPLARRRRGHGRDARPALGRALRLDAPANRHRFGTVGRRRGARRWIRSCRGGGVVAPKSGAERASGAMSEEDMSGEWRARAYDGRMPMAPARSRCSCSPAAALEDAAPPTTTARGDEAEARRADERRRRSRGARSSVKITADTHTPKVETPWHYTVRVSVRRASPCRPRSRSSCSTTASPR